jgi:phosphoribosyl 1,2-cyclic phosphodiesterase
MRLWLLGSGSGGNALLLECGDARLLVDAGFGVRTLATRLRAIGVAPRSVEACVITHEHMDHMKGAVAAARRWGWSLHATRGTVAASPGLAAARVHVFSAGDSLTFSTMVVTTARTPHDAAEPIGVTVTANATGARAAVCTDIGHVSAAVRALCADVDVLVLESNHDEGMLRVGPYPPSVQARIGGANGHLANRHAAALIRDSATPRLRHVVLAHISQNCNQPALARAATEREVRRTVFRGKIATASQDAVAGPFDSGSSTEEPAQYVLAL